MIIDKLEKNNDSYKAHRYIIYMIIIIYLSLDLDINKIIMIILIINNLQLKNTATMRKEKQG